MGTMNIAVIGGTGGLGRAIARYFAAKGESVTVYGRKFRDEGVDNIKFVKVDLSLMSNVKLLVEQGSFDIFKYKLIVFTAGIFAATKRQETSEGLELDLAASYINRYLLLEKSLPLLPAAETSDNPKVFSKPRIFVMGYPGANTLGTVDDLNQTKSYGALKAHMNTVAGNEALVCHYADRANFNIYGLNPGLAKTNIRDNFLGKGSWLSIIMETIIGWTTKTPEQYAEVICPLLVDDALESQSGSFFNDKAKEIPASKGFNKVYADKFIEESRELLESKGLF